MQHHNALYVPHRMKISTLESFNIKSTMYSEVAENKMYVYTTLNSPLLTVLYVVLISSLDK